MAHTAKKDQKVSDKMLVERFRKGSVEAFEEIVNRYEAKLFNLAFRFTRNQEDAEEVLQDVFSTVFKKVDSFQGKSAFSSWMYRITVNAAFMKLRKRKQRPAISIEDLAPTVRQKFVDQGSDSTNQSDTITLHREMREVLQAAINKLPEQYRAVFVLRDVDGLSNQETGEILQLSIPAVKSRLHRSRLMLRRKLQRYWDDYTEQGPTPSPVQLAAAVNGE